MSTFLAPGFRNQGSAFLVPGSWLTVHSLGSKDSGMRAQGVQDVGCPDRRRTLAECRVGSVECWEGMADQGGSGGGGGSSLQSNSPPS